MEMRLSSIHRFSRGNESTGTEEATMNQKKKRILVIDDDRDFVRTLGMILKSEGYEVLEAFSGKEGLEKSKAEDPDLYVIDLMMETYSEGSNLAKALGEDERTKGKPKIMITSVDLKGPYESHSSQELVGCDIIMQKPVLPKDLIENVSKALGRK
jgi:two-component system alkaline phosphatase synthesis response regulator PhoP